MQCPEQLYHDTQTKKVDFNTDTGVPSFSSIYLILTTLPHTCPGQSKSADLNITVYFGILQRVC